MNKPSDKIIALLIILAVFSFFQMVHTGFIRHNIGKIEAVLSKEGGE